RGTLAARPGMSAEIPKRRLRPLRTMDDMGMSMEGMSASSMKLEMDKNMKAGGQMSGMDHSMNMPGMKPSGGESKMPEMQTGAKKPDTQMKDMPGMPGMQNKPDPQSMRNMPGMPSRSTQQGMNMPGMNETSEIPGSKPVMHGPNHHGIGNQSTPESTRSSLDDPGIGLGGEGRRVLVYTDLEHCIHTLIADLRSANSNFTRPVTWSDSSGPSKGKSFHRNRNRFTSVTANGCAGRL